MDLSIILEIDYERARSARINIKMKDKHGVWFRTFLDVLTPALLLHTVCCNAKLDITPCSTSLHPDYLLEKVTQAELKLHTFTGAKTRGEARKQCKRRMRKHGFLLFSNEHDVPGTVAREDRDEWNTIFHEQLPALLRQDAYKKMFSPIFARVRGTTEHRFGDRLRLQLKLKRALKTAKDRSAQKRADTKRQAENAIFARARNLLLKHYRALVKVRHHILVGAFHCALS